MSLLFEPIGDTEIDVPLVRASLETLGCAIEQYLVLLQPKKYPDRKSVEVTNKRQTMYDKSI